MILVTGHAGFIGRTLWRALEGREDTPEMIGIDAVGQGFKMDEYDWLMKNRGADITAVFHLGAISDTTCTDWPALNTNNFVLSKKLGRFCMEKNIPFIYASSASVYGNGAGPLNDYATSKMMVDQWAEAYLRDIPWYGCRFFNVYGPGEEHKGKQASLVHQFLNGKQEMFLPGTVRDFVHVDDVVDVMIWMWRNKPPAGIYDIGTGEGVSLAKAYYDIEEATGTIYGFREVDMPAHLVGKYQFHTCADIRKLRQAGYDAPFTPLHEGIRRMLR